MADIELVEKLCLVISEQAQLIKEQNELIEQSDVINEETKSELRIRVEKRIEEWIK